ncbi:hypothetical protein LZ023_35200 (plasmid) [Pseudomonas silvicola]|nr:hypothetical protein LZ023_35200 [Pseudomonas silvicola]
MRFELLRHGANIIFAVSRLSHKQRIEGGCGCRASALANMTAMAQPFNGQTGFSTFSALMQEEGV